MYRIIIFNTVNVSSNLAQILLSKSQSIALALVEEHYENLVFTNKAVCVSVCVLISWQACQGFLGYIKVLGFPWNPSEGIWRESD